MFILLDAFRASFSEWVHTKSFKMFEWIYVIKSLGKPFKYPYIRLYPHEAIDGEVATTVSLSLQ